MSGSLDAVYAEQMANRASAAVRLIDTNSSDQAPIGQIQVSIDDPEIRPVRNVSGWYVFMDLQDGSYTVRVVSEYYLEETVTLPITSSTKPVLIDLNLLPRSSYPFPSHATLIRAVVRDVADTPISDAAAEAAIFVPEDGYKATLAAPSSPGDQRIKLSGLQGALLPGSTLLIKAGNQSRLEFCRIAEPLPADPAGEGYLITGQLEFPHPAGTFLYALKQTGSITSRTDIRGEFVIPFTRLKFRKCFTALSVTHAGYIAINRDIQCDEGRTASLGLIKLLSI